MAVKQSQQRLLTGCQVVCCYIVLIGVVGTSQHALAQIVPDATLAIRERSQVSAGSLKQIDGGAVRDRNLFHSFEQFSLLQGETAFFNNAASIENVIARVTGGQRSTIDGLIRANGTANVFLINPSGILFGPNAALNLGGSFLATTATAIAFGNQGTFSATAPTSVPLLTVSPSALLFNQIAAQSILDRGTLQVLAGQSLALVGGDVTLDNGTLLAPGGRVTLGGLKAPGSVALSGNGSTLRADFSASNPQALADVSLLHQSEVNVRSGGSVEINAYNVNLADRSIVRGGIGAGQGFLGSKAGDIDINASGTVNLVRGSFIANSTLGISDSGNVNISGGPVQVSDGSQINASTFGLGNGGTVTLRSLGAVTIDGEAPSGRSSGIYSQVNPGAVGNSGGINITAASVAVTNGALLTASTQGQGNAGTITIAARDSVRFDGVGAVDRFPSGAYTNVGLQPFGSNPGRPGMGNSGGLSLTAGSLFVGNGALLDASTSPLSHGNAGKTQIQVAGPITLGGDPSNQLADPGGIYSYIGDSAIGNSGGITLTAQSLSLKNGAALVASTFGRGNAGDVNLQIAGPVLLDGQTLRFSSGIFSSVSRIAQGNSGQIRLSADSLAITNGAAIAASTLGHGMATSVIINTAGSVSLDGVGFDGFPSGVFSRVGAGAIGNSDITVTARSLSLTKGAQFQASTIGPLTAGSIRITTTDDVRLIGKDAATGLASGLFSTTSARGDGGDINVNARSLDLRDGAMISAQSRNSGRSGSIAIHLRDRLQASDSQIVTTASQSAGGNIAVTAHAIVLRGDSNITTSVFSGAGGGGNITLGARAIVALEDSDILAFSRDGSGGNITLNTPAFFGFRYQPLLPGNDPARLDGNNRADVNASGRLRSGTITLPDVTLLQNSLTQLPSEVIDTGKLIAGSCIAHSARQGSFIVSGAGGLPTLPDDLATSPFPTYAIAPPSNTGTEAAGQPPDSAERGIKAQSPPTKDTIVEIDGIYPLSNGEIVLGRSCF